MITLQRFHKDNADKLNLTLLTEERALKRRLVSDDILRPSYALTGFFDYLKKGRVLLFDHTDLLYYELLPEHRQTIVLDHFIKSKITCFIFAKSDYPIPQYLIDRCIEEKFCVYSSDQTSTKITHVLSDYLDFHFAPIEHVHGTLVDVWGIGILFIGRSGIGKSEVALDLVERGHRLVADDLVICKRKNKFILMGEGREFAYHYLEIRGVGLIDVKQLYGIRSVRVQKRIEVVVELVDWDPKRNFDRIGLEDEYHRINEVDIPKIVLPIFPGKNMTVLSETIALNHLLKIKGVNPAKEFNDNLIKQMRKQMNEKKEFDAFLDDDYE